MLTGTKYIALTMLTHSLVSGLYQKDKFELSSDIKDFDIKKKKVDDSLKILTQSLEEQGVTMDRLQGRATTIGEHQLQYYYILANNNLNRFIKEDDEMIYELIGLSISSYLIEEKDMGTAIGTTPRELIDFYLEVAKTGDSKTKYAVKRSLIVGSLIVESIEKSSYATYNRKMKKNLRNSKNKKKC